MTRSTATYRMSMDYLWKAQHIKRGFIAHNPERYDTPNVRAIIAKHVAEARRLNHLSIQQRRRERA